MNAALFLIIGIVVLVIGYIFYGGWLAKKWGIDNSRVTPAHELDKISVNSAAITFPLSPAQAPSTAPSRPLCSAGCP